MLPDPRRDLIIGCPGGGERLEGIVVDLRELQPSLAERTVGVIFPLPAGKNGAAFVHCASGEYLAPERSARAARVFFTLPQIARQHLHFFEVWFHRLT